jgi:hypothetical protein
MAAAGGIPMITLMEWMGHANIGTTQKYAHYAPRHDDARRLEAAFDRRDSIDDSVVRPSDPPESTSEHLGHGS